MTLIKVLKANCGLSLLSLQNQHGASQKQCLINVYVIDELMHGWCKNGIVQYHIQNLRETMRCSKNETIKNRILRKVQYESRGSDSTCWVRMSGKFTQV